MASFLYNVLSFLSFLFLTSALASDALVAAPPRLATRQGTPGSGVLRDFEVHTPVLTPESNNGRDAYGCVVTQTLMVHQFANSYGKPFVGGLCFFIMSK
jgi:hypothetical protein